MKRQQLKLMPVGTLTAAIQEPGDPGLFVSDPIRAAMETTEWWINLAKRHGNVQLQLGAALTKPDSWKPEECMLDPVAAHLAAITRKDGSGEDLSDANATQIITWCDGKVVIGSLGFFENMLHENAGVRNQLAEHLLRVGRASVLLAPAGCKGVTIFLGRNPELSLPQNLALVVSFIMPLLVELKKLGVKRVLFENCPMPGWNTRGLWVNNLANTPYVWYMLWLLARKFDVADIVGLTYDASHDLLQGTRPEWSFAFLKAAGCESFLKEVHGKDLHPSPENIAAFTRRGQQLLLPCHDAAGLEVSDLSLQGAAWGEMIGGHSLPGIKHYNPTLEEKGLECNWRMHQLLLRTLLGLDVENSVFIVENEFFPIRNAGAFQSKELYLEVVETFLGATFEFVRHTDALAAAEVANLELFASSSAWLKQGSILVPNKPWDDGLDRGGLANIAAGIRGRMHELFGTELEIAA